MAQITRTIKFQVEVPGTGKLKFLSNEWEVLPQMRDVEMEVSANVWEKGDARIVYFNVPMFKSRSKKIASWDINAQAWKDAPTGEHKQAAEAKAEALKIEFFDLIKYGKSMTDEELVAEYRKNRKLVTPDMITLIVE